MGPISLCHFPSSGIRRGVILFSRSRGPRRRRAFRRSVASGGFCGRCFSLILSTSPGCAVRLCAVWFEDWLGSCKLARRKHQGELCSLALYGLLRAWFNDFLVSITNGSFIGSGSLRSSIQRDCFGMTLFSSALCNRNAPCINGPCELLENCGGCRQLPR